MTGYFQMLNEKGGINGRKVNLISLDNAFSPPKAIEQTRKLVENEKSSPKSAPSARHPTSPSKNTSTEQGPSYLHLGGWPKVQRSPEFPLDCAVLSAVRDGRRHLWTVHPQEEPNAKIAVLYQNDDYGKDYLTGFKEALGTGTVKDRGGSQLRDQRSYRRFRDDPAQDLRRQHADPFHDAKIRRPGHTRKANELNWKPAQLLSQSGELGAGRADTCRAGERPRRLHDAVHKAGR